MINKHREQLRESATQASTMLRAPGNEYRLLILCHLPDSEHQVGELQSKLALSQSALSRHLARLRHEGLVKTRRESQTIHYSLADNRVRRILENLTELYCGTIDYHKPPAPETTETTVNY